MDEFDLCTEKLYAFMASGLGVCGARHNFCFEIYQMQIRHPLKLRFEVLFHKNYDHLNKRATPERKSSVLPLLQKMYRNIGEDAVQYVPITQQGSVQQLYLSEEASTIDHEYLEDDKPSINFLPF